MGQRGRPKQPTALRILRGNPGKRPIPENEPQPAADAIEPPAWVTGPALDKWHEVVPKLVAMGLMTNADTDTIGHYCVTFVEWLKHLGLCQRGADIIVMKDEAGKVRYAQVSPSATLVHKMGAQLLKIAREFGMTPSSRTGIASNEAGQNDPLAAFLSKQA
jgi:P27 family predicted phage terminase small subunit